MSVFAIYVCFNASEDVPNEVISLVVLAVAGTSVYFWFLWWHRNWVDRCKDMQEQINSLRMDLINAVDDETSIGIPRLRSVK